MQDADPPPPGRPLAEPRFRRRADHPRRGAHRRGLDRHGIEGAQRRRPAQPGDPRQGAARRPRDRLPAERPGAEPAPREVAHHRHHLQRQLRPLHLSDRRGAGGAAGRRGHRRLHVQRHRRSGARAPASRPAAGQADRRAGGDRAARRQARRRSARSRTGCRSSTSSPRPTTRGALSLLPDDEGGAVLAVEHLAALGRKRIAHITGPEHFEAVRLRRSGYRSALAEAGLPEIDGFYLSGVWSEAWGREAVAQAVLRHRNGRTRSSAATTRSPAARPMRCARWGWRCRPMSPSSASTIGR